MYMESAIGSEPSNGMDSFPSAKARFNDKSRADKTKRSFFITFNDTKIYNVNTEEMRYVIGFSYFRVPHR